MKRHSALAPLSRDHHHALVLARRLREASAATVSVEADRFLGHWREEERLHFRLEDEILLPAYAAFGDLQQPPIIRMLLDHVLIRRDAELLSREPSLQLLHALGTTLEAHVRLEEREVFPLIEDAIPAPELQAVGERLRQSLGAQEG
jgi:hemerythrin HHE cation binding domain-containing protein